MQLRSCMLALKAPPNWLACSMPLTSALPAPHTWGGHSILCGLAAAQQAADAKAAAAAVSIQACCAAAAILATRSSCCWWWQ